MNQGEFIEAIAPGAKAAMQEKAVLASLTMAQAILESGWGESTLASVYYNLFGIKGVGPAGSITLPTQEWDGTTMQTVQAEFRRYTDWAESITDHADMFVRLQRYANLIGETDYRRACVLVQKDGYATDPNYADKLIRVIETYGLARYDQEVIVDQQLPDWGKEARDGLIAMGITDGSRPADPSTRLEVWAMLYRGFQAQAGQLQQLAAEAVANLPKPVIPTDVPEWAADSLKELNDLGLMGPDRPNHYATRAEVAVVVARTMQLFYDELAIVADDLQTMRDRVTEIENQLEEKGLIGKMIDLVLKPFRKGGN